MVSYSCTQYNIVELFLCIWLIPEDEDGVSVPCLMALTGELTYIDTHILNSGGNQRTWRKPLQAQGEQANSKVKGPAPGRHVKQSGSPLSHLKAFLRHCFDKNETDGQHEKMMPPATAGATKET